MSKKLWLFSISTLITSTVFAGGDSCDPCCEPCESCCVPKPKKCIDCECYTPAFDDLQCDWGVFITADFLYWYARESNLSYAVKQKTELFTQPNLFQTSVNLPKKIQDLDAKWDPGVRVGIGWRDSCDGWDVYLHWTYLKNKEEESISTPLTELVEEGDFSIVNPWVYGNFFPRAYFEKVSAKWNLTLNSIDLEIGRKYWLSPCFNLRPFAGLRGAWTKTVFRTRSILDVNLTSTTSENKVFKDRFNNEIWGVGFISGIQPHWYFTPCFLIFSNLDISLIWGRSKVDKKENYTITSFSQGIGTTGDLRNRIERSYYRMQGILDLALGLRWENTWCCERYRTSLDLGWEHHIWFDNAERFKYLAPIQGTTRTFSSFVNPMTDLHYGGFVLRVRFDF